MTTQDIIQFFCLKNNVDHTRIYGKDHNQKLWSTRYMVWHYLHHNKGVSIGKLVKIFGHSRPNVFRGIRIFREHMKYHKDIRERYNGYLAELEGMTEAAPSNDNMEEKN